MAAECHLPPRAKKKQTPSEMICTQVRIRKSNNCSMGELAVAKLNFRTRYISLIHQVYMYECR